MKSYAHFIMGYCFQLVCASETLCSRNYIGVFNIQEVMMQEICESPWSKVVHLYFARGCWIENWVEAGLLHCIIFYTKN